MAMARMPSPEFSTLTCSWRPAPLDGLESNYPNTHRFGPGSRTREGRRLALIGPGRAKV